ncbi:pentapeptide repeat-containing protein [Corallococcus sp. H22C18031201]|nr:pentapeptide repeat-containing protein [Citreicoccus inhibens]RJS21940.1 pentapeptide repeat-containing protein [Corallococcus sp. H22C18031201]
MSTPPARPASDPQRLLTEETFEGETFTNLDLESADLRGKEFFRCSFQDSRFQGSVWSKAKLEECVYSSCDLTRAQFSQTAMRGVRFENSKLMGIDWSVVAPFHEMSFEGCNLRYGSFLGLILRKTRIVQCIALETSFTDMDLAETDFEGTDLSGCTFHNCNLTRADFQNAMGVFIDPARNRVKETRVPVEAAVQLAKSLGLVVPGYGEGPKLGAGGERKRRR